LHLLSGPQAGRAVTIALTAGIKVLISGVIEMKGCCGVIVLGLSISLAQPSLAANVTGLLSEDCPSVLKLEKFYDREFDPDITINDDERKEYPDYSLLVYYLYGFNIGLEQSTKLDLTINETMMWVMEWCRYHPTKDVTDALHEYANYLLDNLKSREK
jgi:hypothetical protein